LKEKIMGNNKNIQEQGRSMVEMLGVLAIIGVLSVGAIAGYQKAMFKYRANKQTELLNGVLDGLIYFKMHDFRTGTNVAYLRQFGFVNDGGKTTYLTDKFNLSIYILYCRTTSYSGYYAMEIGFGKNIDTEVCLNVLQFLQSRSADIGSRVHWQKNGSYSTNWYADAECTSTRKCLKNMTLNDKSEFCSSADHYPDSKIRILF
jgi:type II secretory pathway pseudopilin PulG